MATCEELWARYQQAHNDRVAQQNAINELNAQLTVLNTELTVIQAELLAKQTEINNKSAEIGAAYNTMMPLWMNEMSIIGQYQNQGCPMPGSA